MNRQVRKPKNTDLDKALKEASKRLPFKKDKELNSILEFAADDLAEAYKIGAEEAQGEIVSRLMSLKVRTEGL